eukprot:TRINITY_DN21308_c0_g1_i11.p1 TRINITY_DN21308_c0_g1~~TRINITY_DN21308_c0_g1_i11.p1  ORF type:complete len:210 (-),score=17.61 TRINITY_DN21308_c0_g1_i11:158-787(-)
MGHGGRAVYLGGLRVRNRPAGAALEHQLAHVGIARLRAARLRLAFLGPGLVRLRHAESAGEAAQRAHVNPFEDSAAERRTRFDDQNQSGRIGGPMNCPEHHVLTIGRLSIWMYYVDIARRLIPLKVWLNPLRYQFSWRRDGNKPNLLINNEGHAARDLSNLIWSAKQRWRLAFPAEIAPISFPEVNVVLAKDQPEYRPLPVHRVSEMEG